MPSLAALAAICVAGAVLYGLGRALLTELLRGGQNAERAQRAERDLDAARRQAEVMLEKKEPQDVANDLDAGDF
jgi:hypothetical protein